MRDLLDAPEAEWAAERAKVETEGWGARLAVLPGRGRAVGGRRLSPGGFRPARVDRSAVSRGRPRRFSLSQLREFGLDPASDRARRTVDLIGANSRWDEGGQPYWEGEVEECINGRTVADGAYFGVDVSPIVERLVGERLADGGWNCERINGSVRSSFASTINVLEGLLEYERATGGTPDPERRAGRARSICLARQLFRRLGTGEPADERFLHFLHPNRWRYDVLRALDYFRSAAMLTGAASRSAPRRGYRPRFAPDAWRTAPGPSTGARAGGCGSRSTTGRASPRGG